MNPWEKYQPQQGPWTQYQAKAKAPAEPVPSAVDEMGGLERFLAGMGNAFNAPYRGVRQALGLVSQQSIDEEERLGKPLMNTGAGTAGGFVGSVLPALAVPAASIPAAIGLGAVQGAAQPVESGNTRLGQTLKGGIAGGVGQGVAKGIGAVMKGPAHTLTAAEKALADDAAKFGIQLTPAQQTGNKFLKTVDSVLESLPATAGKAATGKQAQAQQFTRALTGTFGNAADDIGEGTMAAAKTKLGDTYQRVFQGEKIDASQFAPRLGMVKAEALRALPADKAKVIANKIDDLFAKVDEGAIDGIQYQKWRSALKSADGDTQHYLKLAKSAVDDAASTSLSPGKMDEFLAANIKYKNMKAAQPIAEKSVNGQASPALVLERARATNKNMAYDGGGDFGRLGKIGKAFIQEQVPNSGTAQRMMAQTLLTGGVGGGTLAMTGDPEQALKAGLGTMASTVLAPKLMQGLLSSPKMQGYLTRGMPMTAAQREAIEQAIRASTVGGLLAPY
jgi:hypothetical protein